MNQRTNSKNNAVEAVVVYLLSAPLLILSLVMILLFMIFFFDNIGCSWSSYDRAAVFLTSQFIFIAAFDITSIVRLSQSLVVYRQSKIKSYQYKVKAFIDLYIMLIFGIIADAALATEEITDNISLSVILFIILIFVPSIFITWRFNKNRDTLRELVISDLKSKRGI
jgi:hypothetical protein